MQLGGAGHQGKDLRSAIFPIQPIRVVKTTHHADNLHGSRRIGNGIAEDQLETSTTPAGHVAFNAWPTS